MDELAIRGTALLFVLSLATLFWWWQINPILESWLSSLPLGAAEGTVSIYDPHGWMSTRWSMIALLALITTLPLAAQQLLSFADEGLLPSERKWLRMVTLGGVGLGLALAIFWWIWGYPLAIGSAGTIGGVDGIGAQYDAVLLFEVGIGISWWIFLTIITLIGLTMARLLSLMVAEPFDPFRIRVHGTMLFLWWLTCPSALEGVWLSSSILLVLIPEILIQWMPRPLLSSKARTPQSVFDSEGDLHRRLFAMCHAPQSHHLRHQIVLDGLKPRLYALIPMHEMPCLTRWCDIESAIWSSVVVMGHHCRWNSGNRSPLRTVNYLDWGGWMLPPPLKSAILRFQPLYHHQKIDF